MDRKFLIISAAAVLVGGTVMAAAQGMQTQSPGAGAEGGAKGQIQGQGGNGGKAPRAKGQTQGQGGMTQGQGGMTQGQDTGPGKADRGKAQRGKTQDQTQGQAPGQRNGERDKQGKQGQRDQGKTPKQSQTGKRGAEGGTAKLTTEQRTKIRQTVIKKGPRVSNVNFSISVGTVVPRDRVRFVKLPPVLVEVYPQYRGYLYFIVGERIVIVEPSSYKIVAVLVV